MILASTALKNNGQGQEIPNIETEDSAMTVTQKISCVFFILSLATLFVVLIADSAFASATFEYETALSTFADSITGPVALTVSIIAMAASGFGIVFGGELTGWIKIACGIICIVGFIVFSSNIFQKIYGSSISSTIIM